jgi:hypothetical protein
VGAGESEGGVEFVEEGAVLRSELVGGGERFELSFGLREIGQRGG